MAYIVVDHNKFEHAASAIDTYISKHKKNMNKINQEMVDLAASWQGADYVAAKQKCSEMNASGSTSDKMIKALDSYADYLRYAGKQYRDVQSRAVNRANLLPRW